MSLFRNRIYLAIILGHFTIDVFNSSAPVLVTFLSVPMGLTAAQLGLAIGSYQLIASVTQPLFGWLADRLGSRWLGPFSITWTVSFVAVAVSMAEHSFWVFMIPFSVAAIGSGAFHPLATMHAGTIHLRRAATATAIFFLFGQGGLATGPALTGAILELWGRAGIYGLVVLSIPVLFFVAYGMRHTGVKISSDSPPLQSTLSLADMQWGIIGLLMLIIGLRSWIFLGTVSFLPKLYQEMGWSAGGYGLITGVFWLASAVAGVVGGHLADRWGRRQVVSISLLLGSILLYFLPFISHWSAYGLVIMSSGLLGASHSILVVIAQALLPGRKAFVSGVTLGYMFGSGAVAVWGVGIMADMWALAPVIQAGTILGLAAAILANFLPTTQPIPHPEGSPV